MNSLRLIADLAGTLEYAMSGHRLHRRICIANMNGSYIASVHVLSCRF